jgi:hypothetical protein
MASFLGIKVEYARLGLIDTVLIVHQIRSWRTFSRCTDRSPSSQTTPQALLVATQLLICHFEEDNA